jgi:hypothetical protein
MEVICSSKILVTAFKTTWHHNPEYQDQQLKQKLANNSLPELSHFINCKSAGKKLLESSGG